MSCHGIKTTYLSDLPRSKEVASIDPSVLRTSQELGLDDCFKQPIIVRQCRMPCWTFHLERHAKGMAIAHTHLVGLGLAG